MDLLGAQWRGVLVKLGCVCGEALGSVCFLETLGELEGGVEGAHLDRGVMHFGALLAASLVLGTTCWREQQT